MRIPHRPNLGAIFRCVAVVLFKSKLQQPCNPEITNGCVAVVVYLSPQASPEFLAPCSPEDEAA